MARRDLTNFNEVTQIVADAKLSITEPLIEGGLSIFKQSEEMRAMQMQTQFQLDANDLSNRIKTEYQSNPEQGRQVYEQEFEKLNQQYSKSVSPFFGGEWQRASNQLKGNSVLKMQNWAVSQAQKNTETYINNSLENVYQSALANGRSYIEEGGDINSLLDYESSIQPLYERAKSMLGEEVANEKMRPVLSKYYEVFAEGLIQGDATQAYEILANNPMFKDSIDTDVYFNLLDKSAKISAESLINDNIFKAKKYIEAGGFSLASDAVQESIKSKIDTTYVRKNEKLNKLKNQSPADYYMELGYDPNNVDSFIAAQKANGVPDEQISLLPKKEAETAAENLNNELTADKWIATKKSLQEKYGDYADNAMNDLFNNGLKPEYQLLNAINVKDINLIEDLADAIGGKEQIEKSFKDRALIDDITDKAFQKDLLLKSLDLYNALNQEGVERDEISAIRSGIDALAKKYYTSGKYDKNEAIEKATKPFVEAYEYGEINGHILRVPSDYNLNFVSLALQEKLKAENIKGITDAKNILLQSNGRFVLNKNQDGYYLVDEMGTQIYSEYKNGLPTKDSVKVEYKIKDLMNKGKDLVLSQEEYRKIFTKAREKSWDSFKVLEEIEKKKREKKTGQKEIDKKILGELFLKARNEGWTQERLQHELYLLNK